MIRPPPRSPLFPSTTLSRSQRASRDLVQVQREHADHRAGQREEPAAAEARIRRARDDGAIQQVLPVRLELADEDHEPAPDRKSTRLNSSHSQISYAVFCLKQ